MAGEIQPVTDAAGLLQDPENIAACLAFLAALQKLEIVLTVNGRVTRCPIRIAPEGAVIEVPIDL